MLPEPEHAKRVLIRGHVFDYEEKAPFVASGVSILGALEYDPGSDRVRCHECGDWFECISHTHLRFRHSLAITEYKHRHGLNKTTGLCSPGFSAKRRRCGWGRSLDPDVRKRQTEILVAAGLEHKRVYGNNLRHRTTHVERANTVGRCEAQTLFRIQLLAAELGKTPTASELKAAGIDHPLTVKYFGSTQNALKRAGLILRPKGRPAAYSDPGLPSGFPSKEALLETRMPWPNEYFGIRWNSRSALSG